MNDDLRALFAELRRIKQTELPRAEAMDPVEGAMHEERIRGAIKMVEARIERKMRDG